MDRHLSSRLQTLNLKKTLHYVNHDFRRDYTNHIKNENTNYYYINNDKNVKLYNYKKMNDKKLNKSKNKDFTDLNRIKKILDETIIKHNDIYLEKYKTKLRTDRTNSFNRGVLTFPKDLENDLKGEAFNKQEFITLGINNCCEVQNSGLSQADFICCNTIRSCAACISTIIKPSVFCARI